MGSDQKLNMIHVIISTDKIYYFIFNLMIEKSDTKKKSISI